MHDLTEDVSILLHPLVGDCLDDVSFAALVDRAAHFIGDLCVLARLGAAA